MTFHVNLLDNVFYVQCTEVVRRCQLLKKNQIQNLAVRMRRVILDSQKTSIYKR